MITISCSALSNHRIQMSAILKTMNPFEAFIAQQRAKKASRTETVGEQTTTIGARICGILDGYKINSGNSKTLRVSICIDKSVVLKPRAGKIADGVLTLTNNAGDDKIYENGDIIYIGFYDETKESDIQPLVGSVVDVLGVACNKQGYVTGKSYGLANNPVGCAIGFPITLPDWDPNNMPDGQYHTALIQFRSQNGVGKDWNCKKGNNAQALYTDMYAETYYNEDKWLSKEKMPQTITKLDVSSFETNDVGEMQFRSARVNVLWNTDDVKQFGIGDVADWVLLGPEMVANVRGYAYSNIYMSQMSSFPLNNEGADRGNYQYECKVYTNKLAVDLETTVKQAGFEVSREFVQEYFDDMDDGDDVDNHINIKSSKVLNLTEFGDRENIYKHEGLRFYVVANIDWSKYDDDFKSELNSGDQNGRDEFFGGQHDEHTLHTRGPKKMHVFSVCNKDLKNIQKELREQAKARKKRKTN